jgi:hypothetical protein
MYVNVQAKETSAFYFQIPFYFPKIVYSALLKKTYFSAFLLKPRQSVSRYHFTSNLILF